MKNNIVSFGLKNVHYAIATLSDDGNIWSYNQPVALKGAQEFTSDTIGGSTPVYADDQVITTLNQNAGRTITLKVTQLPDEFKIDILGYKRLENGNLIEIANAPVVTFALGLEFQGDVKARRMWFYLCTATPVSESTKSKTDSVEANATSITISARPIEVDEDTCITYILASKGDDNYATFLTNAPALPTQSKGEN